MSHARILLPRRKANSAIIEAFYCSGCAWECVMPHQQPGVIYYDDVDRAAQKFDRHRCELYARADGDPTQALAAAGAHPPHHPAA